MLNMTDVSCRYGKLAVKLLSKLYCYFNERAGGVVCSLHVMMSDAEINGPLLQVFEFSFP